jgi:hypothetical protein
MQAFDKGVRNAMEEKSLRTVVSYWLRGQECKGKGKAVPLQAWTGPQGSRRSRLPDF